MTQRVFLSLVTTWSDAGEPSATTGSLGMTRCPGESGDVCWSGEACFLIDIPWRTVGFDAPGADVRATWGSLRYDGRAVIPKTEVLYFAHSDAAAISSRPIGPLSFRWLGRVPSGAGIPALDEEDGRAIRLGREVVGVLEASYRTEAERWYLAGAGTPPADVIVDDEGVRSLPVTVSAWTDAGRGSIRIVFSDADCEPAGGGGPVTIRVVDICGGGDPIPGAVLKINGMTHTLADGTFELAYQPPDTTIAYEATAENFSTATGSQKV